MFSLAKKPDRRIRRYEHNGVSVTITPSVLGIATIGDKDVWICMAGARGYLLNPVFMDSNRQLIARIWADTRSVGVFCFHLSDSVLNVIVDNEIEIISGKSVVLRQELINLINQWFFEREA